VAHLVVEEDGAVQGILPGYLKSHSQGEYVFDHGWADAWTRAGQRYYPKMQHAAPFTPATGRRLLVRPGGGDTVAATLVAGSEALCRENGFSGSHATFLTDGDAAVFEEAGWMPRHDVQYHWFNEEHDGFDAFLGSLASRKRKVLKRERAEALAAVDAIDWLTGAELTESAWDAFWEFYQDTGARKWGRPYLTREFFSLVGERMADEVLLVMARKNGAWIAGAINFIGADALYGRNWGCTEEVPFLHFEVCYHQAIDFACARGLSRVEAGAQGSHKLARGYRAAVAEYLARERRAVLAEAEALEEALPFRRG
jgi:predicted N-acyltransferase